MIYCSSQTKRGLCWCSPHKHRAGMGRWTSNRSSTTSVQFCYRKCRSSSRVFGAPVSQSLPRPPFTQNLSSASESDAALGTIQFRWLRRSDRDWPDCCAPVPAMASSAFCQCLSILHEFVRGALKHVSAANVLADPCPSELRNAGREKSDQLPSTRLRCSKGEVM
jgi:hypothetical protein